MIERKSLRRIFSSEASLESSPKPLSLLYSELSFSCKPKQKIRNSKNRTRESSIASLAVSKKMAFLRCGEEIG